MGGDETTHAFNDRVTANLALQILTASQLIFAVALLLISFETSRRPDIFFRNSAVDAQHTVSFLKRFTFAWASRELKQARSSATSLNLKDLPILQNDMRAAFLLRKSKHLDLERSLWRKLWFRHKQDLCGIYILAISHCMAQLAPQWVMYRLLQHLERRSQKDFNENAAWIWVIALGFSISCAAWLETQLLWITNTKIIITLRSELTATIYAKVLRKKNVVPISPQVEHSQTPRNSDIPTQPQVPVGNGCTGHSETKQSRLPKSSPKGLQEVAHDINNLVALDTQRLVDLVGASHLLPSSVAKLTVSMAFLCYLIGWKSVLSGLMTLLLLNCVNWYCSRLMNASQLRLMFAKDAKMSLINEALQGIKHIKFTATENDWLKAINNRRSEELRIRWRIFKLRTTLVGLWQIGPILFSAISLALYASLNGSISPSVAFTALGIFGQIEAALAILPKLVVQMYQATVSIERIERFLQTSDQKPYLDTTGNRGGVVLGTASFSWPKESEIAQSDFRINNVNASFPHGQLTVVTGETGSGKSLLLNSLVGEANHVSGLVALSTKVAESENKAYLPHTWPPDSGVAFVSQSVWIENATIRDNVLFGLPFYERRYRETLFACALDKDVEMFLDGDSTEVGVGGTNLSGGQKWRLSFARALYSYATVLVVDDIFSAVDAHVGRHIYLRGLNGPLAYGRTRILATHHTDLCKKHAQCFVQLSHGRLIVNSSATTKVQDQFECSEIETNGEEPNFGDITLTDNNLRLSLDGSDNQTNEDLQAQSPNRGRISMETTPRKFIEEEKRETGAVKFQIYQFYIRAAGGFGMLLFVLGAHLVYTGSLMGRVSSTPAYASNGS